MAIETKEILSYLNIPEGEVDSIDKLKEKFEASFIKKDIRAIKDDKELFGKVTGAFNESNKTVLKQVARENGVDLSSFNLDEMHTGEIFKQVFPAVVKEKNALIEQLTEETKKGPDKKLTDIQAQFEAYKAEVAPKITGYETLKGEFEGFKQSVEQEKINSKLQSHKDEAWGGFKWAAGADEYTKKGFISEIESKYKLKFDESGSIIAVNDKGEPVKDTSKAGAIKSFAQILEEEGMDANKKGAKILAVNNQPTSPRKVLVKEESTQPAAPSLAPLGARTRKVNTSTRQQSA